MSGNKTLTDQSMSAALWGYIGTVGRIGVQMIAQVVLARMLGPTIFGIYAVGMITVSISNFVADMGMGPALVQKRELREEDYRLAFTWQTLMGSVLVVLIVLSAGLIADWFEEPRSVPVIQALAVICWINAVSSVSLNRLRRELEYRAINTYQLISFVAGTLCLAVSLAFLDFKVWSLVWGAVAQSAIFAALVMLKARHAYRPLFYARDSSTLFSFGFKAMATNIVNWLLGNVDRVMVGIFFSSRSLGAYTVNYNLISVPVNQMLGVLQSVLFSATSRRQDENDKLEQTFCGLLNVIALLVFPVLAFISSAAPAIVDILFGARWTRGGGGEVLAAISIAMIFYSVMAITTPFLWATNRVGSELRLQLTSLVVLVIAVAAAAQFSTAAVAWSVAGAYGVRSLLALQAWSRQAGISIGKMMEAMGGGALSSILIFVASSILGNLVLNMTASYWLSFAASMMVSLAIFVAMCRLWPGMILGSAMPMLEKSIFRYLPALPGLLFGTRGIARPQAK